ncbi:MAG TPA: GNAT family N-acetyltransferase [Bryobacteraceae bacterium]|nr:GNAT family N-acetyltransferase [Bryobacteraceae bacterium]
MIELRTLIDNREFHEAVELQKTVWNFSDVELLPVRLFVVALKVGGQAFGAFDGGHMVGFLLSIPGLKPGGASYLHSHMLGVLPDYRNRGVGRMLKLRQREDALARGIDLIEWTFDPLELKNAFFNIERLGAIVRRYVENQYGTTTSPLHGGLPTDRCVAEWWLASPCAEAVMDGRAPARKIEERIEVPAEIATIRREEPRRAREIQKSLAARLTNGFDRGLAVIGFERSDRAGTYLLGRWPCESNA